MRRTTDGASDPDVAGRRRALAVALAAALTLSSAALVGVVGAGSAAAPAADAPPDDPSSALIVDLEADGDATVIVTQSFDLADDADREAFEALRNNETKRDRLERRTATRLERVADGASNETDRTMTIDGAEASFETTDDGERGRVEIAVTWRNLAAVDGEALRVDEPFASGFDPDRAFVVRPPDGYALTEATPEPATADGDRLTWTADASLEGYEVRLSPADDGEGGADADADGTTDDEPGGDATPEADGLPGFGVVAALVALAGAAVARRRTR